MTAISAILRFIFTYLFYPVLVIGIFAYIIASIIDIVAAGKDGGAIRRATAAFLPFAVLVFLIVSESSDQPTLPSLLKDAEWWIRFLIGAGIGLVLLEIGQIASRTDKDIGASVYALFLSLVGVFILYCLMTKLLYSIHDLLLGLVVAGALDIVFRGPPQIEGGMIGKLMKK